MIRRSSPSAFGIDPEIWPVRNSSVTLSSRLTTGTIPPSNDRRSPNPRKLP